MLKYIFLYFTIITKYTYFHILLFQGATETNLLPINCHNDLQQLFRSIRKQLYTKVSNKAIFYH